MEGKDRMVFGHHSVDGMAELMGHGGDVSGFPGEVQHHVRCLAWRHAVAIGTA